MAHADPCVPRANVRPIGEVARDSLEHPSEPLPKRPRTEHNCDICRTSYSERRTLLRHQKTPAHCRRAGLAVLSYSCDRCGEEFARDDLRHRHEREVHFNISRSTGRVRPSTVTTTEAPNGERIVPSQSVQTIRGPASTPSASTVSPHGTSTLSLGTSSTPQTDLELEPSQVIREQEMVDAEIDRFQLLSQAPDLPSDRQIPSGSDISVMSPISEEESSDPHDQELEPSPPDLIADTGSIRSMSTVGSIKSRFLASTTLSRSALIYKGATPRVRGYKVPVLCVLCTEHLGSSVTEIRAHLGHHSNLFNEKLSCQTCHVSFTHERDLILHEKSIAKGHCGFDFEHIEKCQGHHPPDIFSEMLTDSDRFQFTIRLQHWEQAQLNAYLDQVNELMQGQPIPRDGDCWSIDAMLNSLVSLSSTQGYRKPRSALEPGENLSRLDNSRLTGALANFDARRKSRNLALAALSGDRAKVRALVVGGANINARYRFSATHKRFPNALLTPLGAAIESGDLWTVKLLIELDANVNDMTGASSFPLFRCIEIGRSDMAQLLLDNKAYVNAQLESRSALQTAISRGDQEMVELLLSHGANVYDEPERSNLINEAINGGHIAIIVRLQQYAANVGILPERHAQRMIAELHNEIMAELHNEMKGTLDPKSLGTDGLSKLKARASEYTGLLQYAAYYGRTDLVEIMLYRGVDVNSESGVLDYALAWAVSQYQDDTVELLLNKGAEVDNWVTGRFRNVLKYADDYDRKIIVSLLRKHGVDGRREHQATRSINDPVADMVGTLATVVDEYGRYW